MGWKAIKDHYRIEHIVQVDPAKGICIGSPYVHAIITIHFDGSLIHSAMTSAPGKFSNADLQRYWDEMKADPEKLKELIEVQDTFERSIPIWTYDKAEIILKRCEDPCWPNVTHDGLIIYENTFSTDRSVVVGYAIRNAEGWAHMINLRLSDVRTELARLEKEQQEAHEVLSKLRATAVPVL